VAARAGVTVQTVIRRYGGKEGLLAAAADRAMSLTEAQRAVPGGDVGAAVDVLLAHYEQAGPGVLRLLAEEHSSSVLAEYAERGRGLHRDWCRTVFSPFLVGLDATTRRRRFAQLVAVCDVYTWKLLRQDAGLSRPQTRIAVLELLEPLLEPR
jgi:AcrR family transcriptional regulator